jgi:ketosteroid isomerase-like protein
MSQRNVEIVREHFDAYRRGDHAAALACLAPDVVYKVAQEETLHGPEQVLAMWQRWEGAWDQIDTDPDEFIDAGDHVVVSVHYAGRGLTSGIEFEARTYEVYTLRDGICVRKVEYSERAEALAAAGFA